MLSRPYHVWHGILTTVPFRSHAMNSVVHNILIIEDHQDIAEMLHQYLDARGYALDYAADGVTGLHLAVTNDYQAIVLTSIFRVRTV